MPTKHQSELAAATDALLMDMVMSMYDLVVTPTVPPLRSLAVLLLHKPSRRTCMPMAQHAQAQSRDSV